jgi:HlyD family secretion protein
VIDILSPREQWTGLGDGYRVTARITTAEIPDATLVPASALFRRGETWAAFVVKGGIARGTSVASPRRAGRFAAVSDGLVAGDRVVLFPPSELSDGNAVVVR